MSITTALKWRYAAKRMDGTKVPQAKMEIILNAIAMAPSSFGLQPYSILIIENKDMLQKIKPIATMQPQITEASCVLVFAAWTAITVEKIDGYVEHMANERNVSIESLTKMRHAIGVLLEKTAIDNLIWSSKQVYIALGIALVAAAEAEVDSTPMEGFDKFLLDELLDLKSKGLSSQVLMAIGFRDTDTDYLVKLKKVRRPKDELFIHIK